MRILARLDRGIQHIPKKLRLTIRTVGLHRRLTKFKRYHWALTICLRQNSKKVVANTRQKFVSLFFRVSVLQEVCSFIMSQKKQRRARRQKEYDPVT